MTVHSAILFVKLQHGWSTYAIQRRRMSTSVARHVDVSKESVNASFYEQDVVFAPVYFEGLQHFCGMRSSRLEMRKLDP